jgi:flagellar basal-body rod protein FlgF
VNVSLFQAAAALNASSRCQEVISENLASSSIPGFKKQDLSFSTIQAGLMPSGGALGTQSYALPKIDTATSFAPGEIKSTGSKTDVAIEGSGFFEIELANGANAYTRDGEFQINTQGQLTTKTGQPVMGDAGPIQLDRDNSEPLSISATGQISQGSDLKGKLKLVDFDNPKLLVPIGAGQFLANDPNLQAHEVSTPVVRQGYLESANTSSVIEMAGLINAMRGFEANQRIIQLQDERMGRTIAELGSPN